MAILLWIYGCSWAILGAIYLFAVIKKRTAVADRESVWFFLAVLLLAPIVVLCIPYILISGHIEGKKNKARQAEYEKQQQLEQEEKEKAKNKYDSLVRSCENLIDSNCIELAHSAHSLVEQERYQEALNKLTCRIIPNGASLEVDFCKEEGHGAQSELYIELPDGVCDYKIFDHLVVGGLPNEIWQAYLIDTLWHILPLWWHANYARRVFIFNTQDIESTTAPFSEQSLAFIHDLDIDVSPQIFKDGDVYYVSCCYWNDWSGLVRECKKVVIRNNRVIDISLFHSEVIYEYECGIRF